MGGDYSKPSRDYYELYLAENGLKYPRDWKNSDYDQLAEILTEMLSRQVGRQALSRGPWPVTPQLLMPGAVPRPHPMRAMRPAVSPLCPWPAGGVGGGMNRFSSDYASLEDFLLEYRERNQEFREFMEQFNEIMYGSEMERKKERFQEATLKMIEDAQRKRMQQSGGPAGGLGFGAFDPLGLNGLGTQDPSLGMAGMTPQMLAAMRQQQAAAAAFNSGMMGAGAANSAFNDPGLGNRRRRRMGMMYGDEDDDWFGRGDGIRGPRGPGPTPVGPRRPRPDGGGDGFGGGGVAEGRHHHKSGSFPTGQTSVRPRAMFEEHEHPPAMAQSTSIPGSQTHMPYSMRPHQTRPGPHDTEMPRQAGRPVDDDAHISRMARTTMGTTSDDEGRTWRFAFESEGMDASSGVEAPSNSYSSLDAVEEMPGASSLARRSREGKRVSFACDCRPGQGVREEAGEEDEEGEDIRYEQEKGRRRI